jgi:hypothetical protein
MDFILNTILDKSVKGYVSITIFFLLGGLLTWAGVKSLGFLGICFGIALLLVSVAMIVLISGMSNQGDVIKIIKRDFSPENHAQLLALYEPYRVRKCHALFVNILNRAKRDLYEVERLSSIAADGNYDTRSWFDVVGFDQ